MKAVHSKFGGNKYGDNDDPKYAIYSGNEYVPSGRRNKRDVWDISVQPTKEAHFATFPEQLVEPCILAGTKVGGGCIGLLLWERYNRQSCGAVGQKVDRH